MASLARVARPSLRSAQPLSAAVRAAPPMCSHTLRTIATSHKLPRPASAPRPASVVRTSPVAAIDLPRVPVKTAPSDATSHLPHPVWVHDKTVGGWLRSPAPAEVTQFMQSEVEDGCLDFGLRYEFHVNKPVSLQAITAAWVDTLFRHPIAGVEKLGDWTNGVWFYPDYDVPENQAAWLKDTLVYLPTGGRDAIQTVLDNQLSEPFSHRHTLHLTVAPNGDGHFVAALHGRHAAYDIQGASTVFCAFEQALAEAINGSLPQRKWGQEVKRLPIPTEQAVQDDIGSFTPEQIQEGNRMVQQQLAKAAEPHYNLPYAENVPNWAAVSSGVNKRANVTLPPEDTKLVTQAVKKAKLSMTPFLVACAMHALKAYAPPSGRGEAQKNHAFFNVVNRRRWISAERNPATHDNWPFFGNSVQVLSAPDRGNDVLRLAQDIYACQWADLQLERPVPLWGLELAQKKYEQSLEPFNPARPPEYGKGIIYVSSPGPLDKGASAPYARLFEQGNVKITNEDLGVNIRMTSGHSLLHMWTFDGKLQIQTTIPKWYEQPVAQKWMEDTKTLLTDTAQRIVAEPTARL